MAINAKTLALRALLNALKDGEHRSVLALAIEINSSDTIVNKLIGDDLTLTELALAGRVSVTPFTKPRWFLTAANTDHVVIESRKDEAARLADSDSSSAGGAIAQFQNNGAKLLHMLGGSPAARELVMDTVEQGVNIAALHVADTRKIELMTHQVTAVTQQLIAAKDQTIAMLQQVMLLKLNPGAASAEPPAAGTEPTVYLFDNITPKSKQKP